MSDAQAQTAETPISGQFNTNDAVTEQATEIVSFETAEGTVEIPVAKDGGKPDGTKESDKPAEPKEQDKFAARFAALTRKEKQIRDRERAMEQRLKQLEAQDTERQQAIEQAKKLQERIKADPIKLMEEHGLTFQQLAEMMLNDGKKTADMVLSEKEQAIQARIDAMEKKLAEKEAAEEQARVDALITNFKSQINTEIKNNEAYELIRANDASELVYQVIEEHHAETGEILDIKKAADAVEEHLLAEAKKHLELNKIKGLLQPAPKSEVAKPVTAQATRTLTNSVSAQTPESPKRKLSNEESLAQAAKLIKWTE